MMEKLLHFLRAERFYLLCLSGLCLIYALVLNLPQSDAEKSPRESLQYQSFMNAEKQFQTDLSDKQKVEALFRQKPMVSAFLLGYSALFGFLFFGGFILLGLLYFSREARSRWLHFYPLEEKAWPIGMLLHVVVHFLAASLLLNLILSFLSRVIPWIHPNALALIHTGVMDTVMAVIIFYELGLSWRSMKSFGFDLKGRSFLGEAGFGLSGYMAVVPLFSMLLLVLIVLAQMFSYEPEPHPLVEVFLSQDTRDQWMIFFSIFLACLWGPIFEEIFFRGFCYPIFKRALGTLPGGILSSFLFALIHLNEFAFLPIFFLGLGLTLLYEKRGNLIAPMVLHIFHNSLFIGYFFIAKALLGPG